MRNPFIKTLFVLVLVSPAAGHAEELPWRKPGLWEVAINNAGESVMRAVKVLQCSDAASEPDVLLSIVPGQENCAPAEVLRSSAGVSIHTRCNVHETKVDARITMKGNFAKAYQGDIHVRYAGSPGQAAKSTGTHFEAKWLGPCKTGMVAGDMVLSNGITVNVLRDKKARESKHEHHEHGHDGHSHP